MSLMQKCKLVFQTETETIYGFYCHYLPAYTVNHLAIHMGCEFLLVFIIPYCLIVHNSVRIIASLFRSQKESVQLKEGLNVQ